MSPLCLDVFTTGSGDIPEGVLYTGKVQNVGSDEWDLFGGSGPGTSCHRCHTHTYISVDVTGERPWAGTGQGGCVPGADPPSVQSERLALPVKVQEDEDGGVGAVGEDKAEEREGEPGAVDDEE